MANGLLGKKLVGSRDTEVVYTVPSAKVATYNVNVLNDGATAANVNLYITDKVYQTGDFENYDSTPSDASVTYTTTDASNTLDLIGTVSNTLITDMKTTPVEPAAANTASDPIVSKEILHTTQQQQLAEQTITTWCKTAIARVILCGSIVGLIFTFDHLMMAVHTP